MKQQINEFKRMQLIAGLITESEYRQSLSEEMELPKVGDKFSYEDDEIQITGVDDKFVDAKSTKKDKTYNFSLRSWKEDFKGSKLNEMDEAEMDEAEDNSFQKPEEDSNIEILKKRYKFSKDLETIASKQNPKLFKIFEPGFNADEIQLGDYIQFFPNEKPDLVFAADEKSVNASHDNAEDSKYNRSLLKKINRERVSKLK